MEAIKKDELMEQFEKDLGVVECTRQAGTRTVGDVGGEHGRYFRREKENGGMEFDVDGGEEKGGTAGKVKDEKARARTVRQRLKI